MQVLLRSNVSCIIKSEGLTTMSYSFKLILKEIHIENLRKIFKLSIKILFSISILVLLLCKTRLLCKVYFERIKYRELLKSLIIFIGPVQFSGRTAAARL